MSKVSGPVSMYYLKPISNDMPLILLFGDHHFSYDNMCECKSCCHEIYSPCFLKKLDRLATPKRPVDFYVESFDDTDESGVFDSPLDKFRSPLFQPCYKKTIKKGSKCPAPNIRWHYSDIRLSKMKNNIEYLFDSIYEFTQFCEAVNRRGYYANISIDTWLEISDYIHNRNMEFDDNFIEKFLKRHPEFRTKRANIGYHILELYKKSTGIDVSKMDEFQKIIRLLASHRVATDRVATDRLADDIIEMVFGYTNATANQSLIYKQFVKQDKKRVFANKDYVLGMMRDSLERKLSSYYNITLDEESFYYLSKFDITYNKYQKIGRLLLHINSTFVDIYTILRIMKKIDSPPALCIGYFGNSHVINLVHILLQTGYYEKNYSVEENGESRCLPFNIDLLNDLSKKSSFSKKSSRSNKRTSSLNKRTSSLNIHSKK